MKSTLLNISQKIDSSFLTIFESLDAAAGEVGIPYFIVGATARDMVLSMGYGIDISRATADIDLGINVSSWDEFDQLKMALVKTGQFSDHRTRQRLVIYNSIPIDIVPFGAISSADGNIRWPPEQDEVMNVVGFEDAFKLAQAVRLREESTLDINFASPAYWTFAFIPLLLVEPPGSGKTRYARRLAGLLEMPFTLIAVGGSSDNRAMVGTGRWQGMHCTDR